MGGIHYTNVLTIPYIYKRTISCSHKDSICFFLHVTKMFSELEVDWTIRVSESTQRIYHLPFQAERISQQVYASSLCIRMWSNAEGLLYYYTVWCAFY